MSNDQCAVVNKMPYITHRQFQVDVGTHGIAIQIELGQFPLAAKLTVKANGRAVTFC